MGSTPLRLANRRPENEYVLNIRKLLEKDLLLKLKTGEIDPKLFVREVIEVDHYHQVGDRLNQLCWMGVPDDMFAMPDYIVALKLNILKHCCLTADNKLYFKSAKNPSNLKKT